MESHMDPRKRTVDEYRLYRKKLRRSIEAYQRKAIELITQIDALQNIKPCQLRDFSSVMNSHLYGLTLTSAQRTAIEQGLLGVLQNDPQHNPELNNVKQQIGRASCRERV